MAVALTIVLRGLSEYRRHRHRSQIRGKSISLATPDFCFAE
jgi:hypothetical protein